MISYIKGELTYKSPTYVLVETGGIGYHVNVSLTTYSKIESLEKVKLLIYFLVKEDSQSLYGFESASERQLFKQLISVSGVGSSTAMIMLSAMTPDELKAAIVGENIIALKKVKGIGERTAKRLVLDLKDKIVKESGDVPFQVPVASNTVREEALKALVTLGFMKTKVQKALNKILKADPSINTVEVLIKKALKLLS